MFCQHCGHPLPDGAKFCSNCGKMASQQPVYTPPQYQQSQVQNQQPSPYTEPVNYKKNAGGQYAPDSYQNANHWQTPKQQPPAYTEPVHKHSGNQQIPHTVPVDKTGSKPGSGSVPPYNPGTGAQMGNSAWQPVQPPVQPQQKRVRKLPILLAAIAVIAVLLVVSGGKKDKTKGQKDDKPAATTAQVGDSKAGLGEEKKNKNGLRYTDEGFAFDDQELPGYYEEVLKAHGSEFVLADYYATTERGYQWDLLDGDAPVVYYGTDRDADTNEITRIYAGHNMLTKGYEEITYEEFEAILLIMEAAHGTMTDEQWDYVNNMQPSMDTETIRIYEYEIDGLTAKLTVTKTTMSLDVCVQDYKLPNQEQTGTAQSGAAPSGMEYLDIEGALSRFPEGNLRFDSRSFKMTTDELVSLFQHAMNQDGVYLHLAKRTPQDEGKYHYRIENDEGDSVGYVVVATDTATNKVKNASFTYNYQPDEDQHSYGTNAVLNFIEAGHGNMTDKQWNVIANAKPFAEKEDYTMIAYKLDGMKATLTIRDKSMFISLKIEE